MKFKKSIAVLSFIFFSLTLSACSSDGSSSALDFSLLESAEIKSVKNGTIQACPSSTLGEMADAFLSSPKWRDFDSVSGGKVVELTGGFTYDGSPATALIQFSITGGSFEAAYLGINGIDQNLLMLSALLNKMCEATI